jgi:hypothetical protein
MLSGTGAGIALRRPGPVGPSAIPAIRRRRRVLPHSHVALRFCSASATAAYAVVDLAAAGLQPVVGAGELLRLAACSPRAGRVERAVTVLVVRAGEDLRFLPWFKSGTWWALISRDCIRSGR